MEKENITENKVIIENREIKVTLCEETKKRGLSVEEFRRLGHESINKRFELLRQNGNIN